MQLKANYTDYTQIVGRITALENKPSKLYCHRNTDNIYIGSNTRSQLHF